MHLTVWNVLYSLAFPVIDPVLVQFGPFTIRWYALSYIFGILLAWRYTRALAARGDSPLTPAMLDDFVTWAVLGIVLGGRIGYVLFYQPVFYTENPAEIFAVWRGGMSFHGGLIGIILAMALFARRRGLRFFHLTDAIATATPIGLFLGASPISSMASCSAGQAMCPGQWSSPMAARCPPSESAL